MRVGACVCVSSWLHRVSSSLQLTYVRERKNTSGFYHADTRVGVKMCLYIRDTADSSMYQGGIRSRFVGRLSKTFISLDFLGNEQSQNLTYDALQWLRW